MATVGEIVRTTLFHTLQGSSVAEMVFTHEVTAADPTDSALLDVMEAFFSTVWYPDWSDIASAECTLVSGGVQILNGDGTVDRDIGTFLINDVGDVLTDNAAAGVAGFFYAPTTLLKARGRKFVPGIAQARIENGVLNATTLAQLIVLAEDYLEPILEISSFASMIPGVLSRVTEAFVPFLDSVSVTDVPAYQRRRKPGVGS